MLDEYRSKVIAFYHSETNEKVRRYLFHEIKEFDIIGWGSIDELLELHPDKVKGNQKNILVFDVLGFSSRLINADRTYNFDLFTHFLHDGNLPDVDIDVTDRNNTISALKEHMKEVNLSTLAYSHPYKVKALTAIAKSHGIPSKETQSIAALLRKGNFSSLEDAINAVPEVKQYFRKHQLDWRMVQKVMTSKQVFVKSNCLVADTIVHTSCGPKRIADVSEKDDQVLFLNESGCIDVCDNFIKQVRKKTKKVVFRMGKQKVESSLEHKFLVYYSGSFRYETAKKILSLLKVMDVFFASKPQTLKENSHV